MKKSKLQWGLYSHLIIIFLVVLFKVNSFAQVDSNRATPTKIRVVMDDNYPPYVFRDSTGALRGILIDQWHLWEEVNQIKVEIDAMDWDEALRRMKNHEYDVIDTVFKTRGRMLWLDFTKPYAKLEVPVFFKKEISGITDVASLKGFIVAVKSGDATIDILKQNGVDKLVLFESYESILRAAKDLKVSVFVVDKPPALYYLYKFGIQDDFRFSQPLNIGEFHRAVSKGNEELLNLIEDGFSRISPEKMAQIEEKWYGTSILNGKYLRFIVVIASGLLFAVLILILWTLVLRRAVKKRTAELIQSEEHFKSIIELSVGGILVGSHDGVITGANQRMELLIGRRREEIIGLRVEELFTQESIKKSPPRYDLLQQGQTVTSQRDIIRGDGTIIPIEMHTKMMPDRTYQSIYHDISERKKNEEMQIQLFHSAKLASVGMLAAGVAHEINNPLAIIKGFIEILSDPEQKMKYEETIQKMSSACDRISAIVSALNIYVKPNSEVNHVIDVHSVINETLVLVSHLFRKEQITIETRFDCLTPLIRGNTGKLQQVLMNLLTNARDAIKEVDSAGLIKISTSCTATIITIAIEDNGRGMDQSQLSHLFEPFYTTKSPGKGTGLGLSISNAIILSMNGRITVKSRKGQGTTFTLELPTTQ